MRARDERGFTLLEMLVALSVLSLAVLALVNLTGENVRSEGMVEARLFANVVAENRAVEALTATVLAVGESNGMETSANRSWRWTRKVSATADADIFRVDIAVRASADDQVLSAVTVFPGTPMKGFTLVEMLVALLIFSLIAAAGVGVMRFTVDNQMVVRAHAERIAEFQRLRAILKADLSQAAERRIRDLDGQPIREAFYGGSGGGPILRFVRRGWENPDGAPRTSLQYVEYRLVDGRLERVTRLALDGGTFGEPQIVAERIRQAVVHFLWHGQWIENLPGGPVDPLPQAVKLDVALDDIGTVSQLFVVTGEMR